MSSDRIASCGRSIREPEQQLEHSCRFFNTRCHWTFFWPAELTLDQHWWSCCHLWPAIDTYEGLSLGALGRKQLSSLPLLPRSCFSTRSKLGLCPPNQDWAEFTATKAFQRRPSRLLGPYLADCSHKLDSSRWQCSPTPSRYRQSGCLPPAWPYLD